MIPLWMHPLSLSVNGLIWLCVSRLIELSALHFFECYGLCHESSISAFLGSEPGCSAPRADSYYQGRWPRRISRMWADVRGWVWVRNIVCGDGWECVWTWIYRYAFFFSFSIPLEGWRNHKEYWNTLCDRRWASASPLKDHTLFVMPTFGAAVLQLPKLPRLTRSSWFTYFSRISYCAYQ